MIFLFEKPRCEKSVCHRSTLCDPCGPCGQMQFLPFLQFLQPSPPSLARRTGHVFAIGFAPRGRWLVGVGHHERGDPADYGPA